MQVAQIIESARAQADSKREPEPYSLQALERLVDALNDEALLSERGAQGVEANLVSSLAIQFKVEDYLAQHPQLLEQPVEKPLFVFGLPRTGTTLAINLLSVDPARRSFLRWESLDPVPPPRPEELHAGPRYDACQAQTQMALKYAPHIAAIHYEDADSPTECQFAMAPTFVSQYYDSMYHVPSYHQWFLHEADYLPAFRFHKRFLQLLQAHAPGNWTLKNPWHPLYLDALTEVYPDARLAMTHRDPVDVVASACSLLKAVRPMFSEQVDLEAIGQMLLETFDVMIERTLAYKTQHGWDAIYDLQYADVMRDPIGELRKLYAHFDEPFTDAAEAAMHAYMAANPKGKHGSHQYNLADYGLSAGAIRERYRDYCERFGVVVKF
ncbi:sulfotransferase [Mangrovimicrobium sediminis]|uniref:Sulfotransferase n=1 Tax=Mangrovimicrobium sediminis TaxID=2562682 RepID=A0A4Z0LZF0_9GAMM|nr:sulfotransferase [Haliea sp. SAOS-164]TGD72566.1 sulfotransferase [Haliea sp. SAOS-164]